MVDILLVGAGGFVGANARFVVTTLFARRFGTSFPYGTMFINATGSFLLGLFLSLAARSMLSDDVYRWLIAIGFCGGYTTFSTYTYEALTLLREGRLAASLLGYVIGSYVLGLLAALAGVGLGNLI